MLIPDRINQLSLVWNLKNVLQLTFYFLLWQEFQRSTLFVEIWTFQINDISISVPFTFWKIFIFANLNKTEIAQIFLGANLNSLGNPNYTEQWTESKSMNSGLYCKQSTIVIDDTNKSNTHL